MREKIYRKVWQLYGKNAIVTGALGLLGREFCKGLAEFGANVAIVDFGLGNLKSVQKACEHANLNCVITSSSDEILSAQGVILPGVGAFGDAMQSIQRLGLTGALKQTAESQKPFLGICLGMQLFLSESEEFGNHKGLSIVPGKVKRFDHPVDELGRVLKVPQVGWNHIRPPKEGSWTKTLLEGVPNGSHMYFCHSFYVEPEESRHSLSVSVYGEREYCSSLKHGNTYGFQFHPERSSERGLKIYENFSKLIQIQLTSKEFKGVA